MGRRLSPHVFLMVLLLHTAAPSRAVQADSLQVPMDLALALLGGAGDAARLVVGAAPPEAESSIPLPAADRVVGGLVQELGGTVVVEVAGDPSEALRDYFEHLQEQGWSRATMPRGQRGGFQTTAPFGRDTWCGDGYSINGSGISLESRTYLRIHYARRDARRSLCDVPERAGFRRDLATPLELPALEPPPGASVRAGGGGSSNTSVDVEATIVSDWTIERIFEHYAEQLVAAGWAPDGQANGDGVSVGRWRTETAGGTPTIGTLTVWSLVDADSYGAVLRMDRPDERR